MRALEGRRPVQPMRPRAVPHQLALTFWVSKTEYHGLVYESDRLAPLFPQLRAPSRPSTQRLANCQLAPTVAPTNQPFGLNSPYCVPLGPYIGLLSLTRPLARPPLRPT